MSTRRYARWTYAMGVKIAKAERRVVSTAMKLHSFDPKHSDLEKYRARKKYLLSQLHRACAALEKAKEHRPATVDSRDAT